MALYDLMQVFYDPVLDSLEPPGEGEEKHLGILASTTPGVVDRLGEMGWVVEVVAQPDALSHDCAVLLVPEYFFARSEEDARSAAGLLSGRVREGGILTVLFPPAWFPSSWKKIIEHHHMEGRERMIVREKGKVHTFTLFTNREIIALFPDFDPLHIITLGNGFRRATFGKRSGV